MPMQGPRAKVLAMHIRQITHVQLHNYYVHRKWHFMGSLCLYRNLLDLNMAFYKSIEDLGNTFLIKKVVGLHCGFKFSGKKFL